MTKNYEYLVEYPMYSGDMPLYIVGHEWFTDKEEAEWFSREVNGTVTEVYREV